MQEFTLPKMNVVKSLIILSTTVSAVTWPNERKLNSIIDDITRGVRSFDSSIQALTDCVCNMLQAPLKPLMPTAAIRNQFEIIHTASLALYATVQAVESNFSTAESAYIVSVMEETLVVDILKALNLIRQRKHFINAMGQSQDMLDDLNILLGDHLNLSVELSQWLAPSQNTAATTAFNTITDAIEDTINLYSI
jgi:hypothetical protein